MVVVGDVIGSGSAQEQAVVGETPNLAARLQGIAEPNTVVIAESTRRLLGSLFDLRHLGGQDLKGIAKPIQAFAALRPSVVESRFDALHASGLTELVGREEELEILLRRWSRAKKGEGQAVLLSGEAGIGKSRLMAALVERLATEPHTRLRYFCSPQHTDSALYPIISQMERAAGLAHGDTAQVKVDKLDALLAQTSTSTHDASLFADMLSLPSDGRYPAFDLSPEQRRQGTLEALESQVEALSRSTPVLMIFEDAHWTDPTSLEALSRVVDHLRRLRVFLIVTFRPEFEPPWIGRPYVTVLTLNRLAQRDIETVIDNIVGNKVIPANIRQDIIERTDGIPLFVEEMTKAVLEAGSEEAVQRTVASVPSPPLGVPASLQASLMARLDRLGSAKELAQVGAANGREFSHALLSAVVSKPEPEVASGLNRLIAAGLLFRQGVPPHASYLFKHALVQDAAYGTMLLSTRRALHHRIADVLERTFPEIADTQPELVAHHLTEAQLNDRAVAWWRRAGQRNAQASANIEAIAHFEQCLELLASLPDGRERDTAELDIRIDLGVPLTGVGGYTAPQFLANTTRAVTLCERLGDSTRLYPVLWGRITHHFSTGDMPTAQQLARTFLAGAERQGDRQLHMVGERLCGLSSFGLGELILARRHFNRALELYDRAQDLPLAHIYGLDQRVAALAYLSLTEHRLGRTKRGLRLVQDALHEALALEHATSIMYAQGKMIELRMLRREWAAAERAAAEYLHSARERRAPNHELLARAAGHVARIVTQSDREAAAAVRSSIDALRRLNWNYQVTWLVFAAVEGFAARGQAECAAEWLDDARALIEAPRQDVWIPDLHLAHAAVLAAGDAPVEAVRPVLEQAIVASRAQSARWPESRARELLEARYCLT